MEDRWKEFVSRNIEKAVRGEGRRLPIPLSLPTPQVTPAATTDKWKTFVSHNIERVVRGESASQPQRTQGPSIPGILGRFIIPLAKGVLRGVGLPVAGGPGEQTGMGVGEALTTMAGTALAMGAIVPGNPVAQAISKIVSPLASVPVAALAARSGLASAAVEGARQAVRGVTGQEVRPEAVVTEGAIGAGVPLGFFGAGKLGSTVAKILPPGIGATPLGELGRKVGRKLLGSDRYDRIARIIAWNFQTPDRYFRHLKDHNVDDLLTAYERSTLAFVRTGQEEVVTETGEKITKEVLKKITVSGPKSPLGAKATSDVLRSEADRLDTMAAAARKSGDQTLATRARLLALDLRTAAKKLNWFYVHKRVVPDEVLEEVAGRIAKALGESVEAFGYRNGRGGLTYLGQYLAFLRQAQILAKHRGGEWAVRSVLSHIYLGLGNLSSGLVNLTGIVNVGAREGERWVARAIEEVLSNSTVARTVAKYLAYPKELILAHGAPTGVPSEGGKLATQLLSNISFWPMQYTDKLLRHIAGVARYLKVIEAGGSRSEALREAAKAARQEVFDFAWNLPSFLRGSGFGGAFMRTVFQFYPFIINQLNFLARLNAEEFGRFLGMQFAIAGAIGLPFARVLDRVVALAVGQSLLDRVRADPDLWKQVTAEGPLATLTGASIADRVDFSLDLFRRWLMLGDAPAAQLLEDFGKAVSEMFADPSPENIVRAVQRFLTPLSIRRLTQAMEAERLGAFVTGHGIPVTHWENPPTQQELTVKALGFTPIREAGGRAMIGLVRQRRAHRFRELGQAWRDLRDAQLRLLASENAEDWEQARKDLADAVRRLREAGVLTETITQARRRILIGPSRALMREVPRAVRVQEPDLMELLWERERQKR